MRGSFNEKSERLVHRVGAAEKLEDVVIDEDVILVAGLELSIAVRANAAREVDLWKVSE
ncbi:MAG TPA: hypothetical protein VI072_30600 [Polyangiaceae bacterium]